MTVFTSKLDAITNTIERCLESNMSDLAHVITHGQDRLAYAVGSGGSAVSAEYLTVCRTSFQTAPTIVCTPLQFVLGKEDIRDAQVWLFSGGGSNADIVGALQAALFRQARSIVIVTSNPHSKLMSRAAGQTNITCFVSPVADPKDGFLATHSLVSAAVALLRATDMRHKVEAPSSLADEIIATAQHSLSAEARQILAQRFREFGSSSVLLLLADPRLSPAATAIETSAWEIGLCPVQRTDFRNFAHGRHVWLDKRAQETWTLSLAGRETRDVWSDIRGILPHESRIVEFDYGNCGRLKNLAALFDSLGIVEALGAARNIDPGKPGVGPFAKGIYEANSLKRLSGKLNPALRQKTSAICASDDPKFHDLDVMSQQVKFLERVSSTTFRGLVLDYDGTIVSTDDRFAAPRQEVIEEIHRLLDGGITLAIATGRGGSAGECFREQLEVKHHSGVLMGYYNGAYLQPLTVKIEEHPAPKEEAIIRVMAWLNSAPELFSGRKVQGVKDSGVQITIQRNCLANPEAFAQALSAAMNGDGTTKVVGSEHSIDVCLATTCKTNVVKAVKSRLRPGAEVLCIGDSGMRSGNDHHLLGNDYGISVHRVCDRPTVCWSIFGTNVTGPDALIRILRAFRVCGEGSARLAASELTFVGPL